MPGLDRSPKGYAEGFIASFTRGTGRNFGIQSRLVTSQKMVDLLYSGPKGQEVIKAANGVHRWMAQRIVLRAEANYRRARARRRNQTRDARRSGFGSKLSAAARAYGTGHPIYQSPNGAKGINYGMGFMVDFTVFDDTAVAGHGRDPSFPYWRSLEFGYDPFDATLPMFTTSRSGIGGRWSAPSSFRRSDPRMIQRRSFAPFETVRIRGFEGYHFAQDAIKEYSAGERSFRNQSSPTYYGYEMSLELPPAWREAMKIVGRGGYRVTGALGNRRITGRGPGGQFVSDPR